MGSRRGRGLFFQGDDAVMHRRAPAKKGYQREARRSGEDKGTIHRHALSNQGVAEYTHFYPVF